ncbi:DUF7483 domain-containing protein [Magnetospirillum gryphiswaldense]|uniref:DUF7483 domain-containing protein n=1 Tax=Magnetospirillum gryphiswaldense TaxID=55518 RepID=UPI00130EA018|nr:LamG-like jellyroll fold domain-containing protein [Magnetospirillum gryphiswaldense]
MADYFTRTPSTVGNRKTWTFSAWVKRCAIGTQQFLLITGINSNESESVFFDANDKLNLWVCVSNTWVGRVQTNAVFRDTASWGHLVISKDVTTATPKIYWNGIEQPTTVLTEFANIEGYVNTTYEHRIGEGNAAIANGTFNGYITQPTLIDGAALDPSAFGETDLITGSWRPKRVASLPANVIRRDGGTAFGDMTGRDGLAGAFDGTDATQASTYPANANSGYVGMAFVSPVALTRVVAVAPVGSGFQDNVDGNISITIYGKNGLPSSATDGTIMGSSGPFTDVGRLEKTIAVSGSFTHVWAHIVSDTVGGTINCADLKLLALDTSGYGTNGFHLDFADAGGAGGTANTAFAGGFGTYQVVINPDRPLPNKAWITQIGVTQSSAETGKSVYILRDDGGNGYTVMWVSAPFNHAGSGLEQVAVNYLVPETGTYVMAVACPASALAWGHDADLIGTPYLYSPSARLLGESFIASIAAGVSVSEAPPALTWTDGSLGRSASGANHWLPVSLGAADVVTDAPTNNYATINRLNMQSGLVLSNGNTSANGSAAVRWWRSSLAMSGGKWYFEMKTNSANNSYCGIGIEPGAVTRNDGLNQYPGGSEGGADGYGLYTLASPPNQGIRYAHNGVYTDIVDAGFNTASVMKVAVDLDAKMLWLGYDNTWIGGGDPAQGTSPTYTLSAQVSDWVMMGCAYNEVTCYFGASGFNLTVPAGFKALCTANMPKPVIQAPSKHMDVVTYTGTGTSQVVTGLGFQPDLVWCKRRDNIESHGLYDSVRGPTKMLYSDLSNGEATDTNGIVSFNANGFAANGAMATNGSGGNYVAWCWKAGGAPVANTVGSIPSTVSANPTAGFSIAKYAGTGTAGTSFGHGLSAAPKFILVKNVSSGNRNANTMDWMVFHAALGNSGVMRLNTTEGNLGPDAGMWNSTAPSTAVVTLGNHERVNYGGDNYIAYCWAEVPGFSKFGAYTGNGSSDGPFVHCGFRPRFVLIKRTDSAENWRMFDAARSPYNVVDNMLETNNSTPEALGNANKLDFTANGFKVRSIDAGTNSNGTYIYAAFAEAPLGGTKTVPAKAR